jgi:hypothetical protein
MLAEASAERLVVIKADGLPFEVVDRLVAQKEPNTGKSVLPWIDFLFYRNGTRLSNFYSRGLSLSAPSWNILDTGEHSLIKGNLEFDRLTLDAYDYLDIFSFVLKNSTLRSTDSPAAKLLDEYSVSLLSDAYPSSATFKTVQIISRNVQSIPLVGSLKRLLTLQTPKQWVDEWTIGLEGDTILFTVLENDLIAKLKDPRIRYLDILIPFFDHVAHLNREPEVQMLALQRVDAAVGRIWNAIRETPKASKTTLVLVSDHGMNTDPEVYSQGFNLVEFFGSATGGGHHVVTNRPPKGAYSFKSLSPAVSVVTTASPSSFYLKGQSSEFPTLALDTDGNERASVYLRHSDLNVLHILSQQLARKDLEENLRSAVVRAVRTTIERNRSKWSMLTGDLHQELSVLKQVPTTSGKPDQLKYEPYIRAVKKLLMLNDEELGGSNSKPEGMMPRKTFGDFNSIYDLQNYVIGLSPQGLVINNDGSLDMTKSFSRLNYFSVLRGIRAKNNVQRSVSPEPVDFIAVRVPLDTFSSFVDQARDIANVIWLFRDDKTQALILSKRGFNGELQLRYKPIQRLTQDHRGRFQFLDTTWRDGLPLRIWEDLDMPSEVRQQWLDGWHTEREWFNAFHSGRYSNAIISLDEHFTAFMPQLTGDPLIARFRERKRKLAQADFIVFANNHWNFNFRGFNPGGNHGGFFRASTHATMMIVGGNETRIPKGLVVDQPYDTLSFAPSVLRLTGLSAGRLPGRVIDELF